METLWHDLRYALRMLVRSPGFTAVAVLTLALEIGANTAIFSVVNAVLLRPLPFRDPDRLYLLTEHLTNFPSLSATYLNYKDWRAMAQSFDGIGAVHNDNFTLTGEGDPARLTVQMTTANVFPLLGVNPEMGRFFSASEDRRGGEHVVLLSDGLWRRRYGGSPDVLGKSLTLNNVAYTVIGVLPASYLFLQPADVFVPFEPWTAGLPDDRGWHPGINVAARLKSGVSAEQARAEMTIVAKQLEKEYPITNLNSGINVTSLREQVVKNVRGALWTLLGAVGFVLLIGCANVGNLFLARSAARRHEMAIRAALGAGVWRILRQLMTESIILSLLGGAAGLAIGSAAMNPLLRLATGSIPPGMTVGLDATVLIYTAAIAVLTGIFFGLAPALQATRLELRGGLNDVTRGGSGSGEGRRLRSAFVVSEIILATMLLVGAGLLVKSFSRMQDVATGFRPEGLLVADLPLSPTAYSQPAKRLNFFDSVLDKIRALPGVRSAGAASFLPVSGSGSIIHFNIQGRPPKGPGEFILAGFRTVSPGYFSTIGLPLLSGRFISEQDTERGAPVIVINRAMAQQFFPGRSPIGEHLQLGAIPTEGVPWMEIVGVVGDVKQSLTTEPASEMYVPFRQVDGLLPQYFLSIVVRTEGNPMALSSEFRDAVRQIDPGQPIVKMRTMEENISTSVVQPKFRATLLSIFSFLALALAAIGIYGVISYSVKQRTREIGIRMTLGADGLAVLRMILKQGIALALLGVGLGLAGAFGLTRLLENFLFQVKPFDPLTFAGVAGVLIVVSLAACWFPARRATRVDPIVALRYE
ncbi:MAG TPA: ABC transporter permease [Candidatus Acidoferrales bacterium]|jgi:putative ABC transport system permease protein|nr:ABC transporter permease [Candidatus Acidoferrales bacterium]